MNDHLDPSIDTYIAAAPDYAKPIIKRLRELIHQGCPNVQETMKWSHPSFTYAGKILCGMAAFKTYIRFGFWQPGVSEKIARDAGKPEGDSGRFGRVASLADLPDDATMLGYIKEAARLTAEGVPTMARRAPAPKKPEIPVPDDFSERLSGNPAAQAAFEKFAPGQRREYLEWITGAKREETREKRIATTLEQLAEGKTLNWKYQACRT